MDFVHRQNYEILPIHLDCHGRVKPSVLLHFAQEAAGAHCAELAVDWDSLKRKNLFWAVIRQRMQISRLPVAGETVTVETWPTPTTRSAYPRATVGYDRDGNVLFRCLSLWVLMDTESRTMVLPSKSGIEVIGAVRGNELAAPRSLPPKLLTNTTGRKVGYTELDRNGHMNNTRYLDWIDDLLPSSFHKENPVREFTICYLSEALEGQDLTLNWELSDGPMLQVSAIRKAEDRVFTAQILF